MSSTNKKLLILDIDETLLFAAEEQLERKEDFRAGQYLVYKRPHLEEFLARCLEWFEVAVWTSSSPAYAKEVIENIFEDTSVLSFVWASDRCTWSYDTELQEYYWQKILKKVKRKGYDLNHVIAIDDTPEKYANSYGNLVRIAPYEGQDEDTELKSLVVYLDRLRLVENVRKIEKRNWRMTAERLIQKPEQL